MTSRTEPPFRAGRVLLGLSGLLLAMALVDALPLVPDLLRDHAWVVIIGVCAVAVGELLVVRMPSGRLLGPMSTSAAFTLALLGDVQGESPFDVPASVVVVLVASGQLLALAARPRSFTLGPSMCRLAAAGAVAGLVREGLGGGLWVVRWPEHLAGEAWAALVLVLVTVVGVGVERLLAATLRAAELRQRLTTSVRDEFGEALPFTLTLLAPAPMAALIAPVVGPAAIPLALVPMLLTISAGRRYASAEATFRESMDSLSRLPEKGGFTPSGHARRTARLARAIGQRLDVNEREVRDLEFAGLLHDLGQVALRAPIPNGATVLAAPTDQSRIAGTGATIIRSGGDLGRIADIVESQATPHHLVLELTQDVPLAARILKVANAFDDHSGGRRDPASVSAAMERLHLGLGYEYDPRVVAALESLLGR